MSVAWFFYAKNQIWQSPASRQPLPQSVLTLPSDPVRAGISQESILTSYHALPFYLKCEDDSGCFAMDMKHRTENEHIGTCKHTKVITKLLLQKMTKLIACCQKSYACHSFIRFYLSLKDWHLKVEWKKLSKFIVKLLWSHCELCDWRFKWRKMGALLVSLSQCNVLSIAWHILLDELQPWTSWWRDVEWWSSALQSFCILTVVEQPFFVLSLNMEPLSHKHQFSVKIWAWIFAAALNHNQYSYFSFHFLEALIFFSP